MKEKNLEIKKEQWTPDSSFLAIMFGNETEVKEKLDKKGKEKIEFFEKGLEKGLSKDDTIEEAITKIVKTALAAEFGPSLSKAKEAKGMIATITRGILQDNVLRKQALVIIDRFAKTESN